MAFHKCTIYREDGSAVVDAVQVAVEVCGTGAEARWYGTLATRDVANLTAGRRYRIALDDGRGGEFLVRRNTVAGGEERMVSVRGLGRLERRAAA